MPRLYVVAVGDKLPGWANEACDEYLKRLPRGFEALLFEVRAEPRTSGKSVPQMMAAEAQRLRAVLPKAAALMPVGGITPENMAVYRAAGATGFGLGSALYAPGRSAELVHEKAAAFVRTWQAT